MDQTPLNPTVDRAFGEDYNEVSRIAREGLNEGNTDMTTMPTRGEALEAIALEAFMKDKAQPILTQYDRGLLTLAEMIEQLATEVYESCFTCSICNEPGTTLETKITNPADPTHAFKLSCGHWNI